MDESLSWLLFEQAASDPSAANAAGSSRRETQPEVDPFELGFGVPIDTATATALPVAASMPGTANAERRVGRKPAADVPADSALAAAREKQRAFRERRAKYIKDLEAEVASLRAQQQQEEHQLQKKQQPSLREIQLEVEAARLRAQVQQLQASVNALHTDIRTLRAVNIALRSDNINLRQTAAEFDFVRSFMPNFTFTNLPIPGLTIRHAIVGQSVSMVQQVGQANVTANSMNKPTSSSTSSWAVSEPTNSANSSYIKFAADMADAFQDFGKIPSLAGRDELVDELCNTFKVINVRSEKIKSFEDFVRLFDDDRTIKDKFFKTISAIVAVCTPSDARAFLTLLRRVRHAHMEYIDEKIFEVV
ncbi:hypothetical protein HDU84_009225 [Entophlyctis sp. JEL0112]|nr:hypothetical protein HDU84_009225 [Entophlyctis sp. JEL0112]